MANQGMPWRLWTCTVVFHAFVYFLIHAVDVSALASSRWRYYSSDRDPTEFFVNQNITLEYVSDSDTGAQAASVSWVTSDSACELFDASSCKFSINGFHPVCDVIC